MVALLAILLAASSPAPLSDGEVWNAGVSAYEAGDVTNALRSLKTLLLSPSHGARAAELMSKIAFGDGRLEEAADLAQKALRATPADARLRRNFMRAAEPLARRREKARLDKALKDAEGKDPAAVLQGARRLAGELFEGALSYRTNEAAKVVALSDAFAARAEVISLACVGVREALAQSVTNEQEAAAFLAQMDETEKRTHEAATAFLDLKDEAYELSSHLEDDLTRFYKRLVLPPSAIDEDLVCQSNAYLDVAAYNGRPWQKDALDYTQSFRAKFPAWARAYEESAQSDTNKPPFTAETQAKISALATSLEKIQLACLETCVPSEQEEACRLIEEIRSLLPKDKGQGGASSPPPSAENQPNGGDAGEQPPPEGDEPQTQDQDPSSSEESDSEEKDESAAESDEPPPEESAVDALLKKAQERNDEHEAQKKARQRQVPLPPNERDW